MIPIFDALGEHINSSEIATLVEEHKIVTLPLAYMRGVTYKNSFIVLDEAQNTTVKQMHLFLTRIGSGSKMVVTGDCQQSDFGPQNGFVDALKRLEGVNGLETVYLDASCVVRHEIISPIDERYKLGRKDGSPDSI